MGPRETGSLPVTTRGAVGPRSSLWLNPHHKQKVSNYDHYDDHNHYDYYYNKNYDHYDYHNNYDHYLVVIIIMIMIRNLSGFFLSFFCFSVVVF